ncbi:DUF551 domain-containing protein [Faecalimonas umbilicata]|mgnify:CR=1 FL=1|uniref:DUF551 domain-containing protein n=1 Tax=Faecalimonas umbilicata TaxID=1912855 RepID=UPI0022E642FE|nr:DUF551 domain-containing protein [Faecalimonas umbilicata]
MNVLEKILEEMKKIKDGNRKEKLYGKYPPQNKRQETLNAYSQGYEDGTDNFYNAIIPIIRSRMDEASDMHGKRLIDANALDEEVRNFFLTIIGDPSQSTVVRECKESFRRIIDEQPTVYEANDWISVEEKLPEVGEIVEVTVHSSGWITDYSSGWVPEEEKTYHAEEHNVYYGYLNGKRQWVFYDDENSENICEKEFGTDKGRVYDVVTAWRLKPEPYIKNPK